MVFAGGYAKAKNMHNAVSKSQNPPGRNPRLARHRLLRNTSTNDSSPSYVTLHLTFKSKTAPTKCRDAWPCKRTAREMADTYNLDSHASNQPVDVPEHIHIDKRDPLRRRARNRTQPHLSSSGHKNAGFLYWSLSGSRQYALRLRSLAYM